MPLIPAARRTQPALQPAVPSLIPSTTACMHALPPPATLQVSEDGIVVTLPPSKQGGQPLVVMDHPIHKVPFPSLAAVQCMSELLAMPLLPPPLTRAAPEE